MLYVITHLKAPWPSGAVVGDLLELEEVPAWALGKCKPADDTEAQPLPVVDTEEVQVSAALAEAEAQAAQEKSAIEGKGKKHK